MKGETKQERFKRVAEKRVRTVLDSIRKLSQCANRRMYEWDEAQVKKIGDAIDRELARCRERFAAAESEEFRL